MPAELNEDKRISSAKTQTYKEECDKFYVQTFTCAGFKLLELDYSNFTIISFRYDADSNQQCSFFEIRRETSQARFQPWVEVST
jgi:hypothetical protein